MPGRWSGTRHPFLLNRMDPRDVGSPGSTVCPEAYGFYGHKTRNPHQPLILTGDTPLDIEQRRRLRAHVEAMIPQQQKALLAILTQSRETEKSASD